MDLLIDTATKVWLDLEIEVVDKLIDSVPNRVQAVIAAKGWYTKY